MICSCLLLFLSIKQLPFFQKSSTPTLRKEFDKETGSGKETIFVVIVEILGWVSPFLGASMIPLKKKTRI